MGIVVEAAAISKKAAADFRKRGRRIMYVSVTMIAIETESTKW
jgi:hypothetical protein